MQTHKSKANTIIYIGPTDMTNNSNYTPSELFNNFLAKQAPEFQPCLTELYLLIKAIVPNAEESLSYQVHCFKHIYMLVGIGVNKKFCSLYSMSSKLLKQMKDDLAGCKVSGLTLHFKPGEPLPAAIITKIVIARIAENEAMALARGKK
jgi:uncharacterized protein YdhG (YjbR/CyaY superfamily)